MPSRGEAARTPSGLPAAAAVGGAAAPLELENPFGDVPGRSALDAMRRCGGAALERAGEGLRFGGLAVRHTLRHKAATAAELSALADESGDGAEGGGGGAATSRSRRSWGGSARLSAGCARSLSCSPRASCGGKPLAPRKHSRSKPVRLTREGGWFFCSKRVRFFFLEKKQTNDKKHQEDTNLR